MKTLHILKRHNLFGNSRYNSLKEVPARKSACEIRGLEIAHVDPRRTYVTQSGRLPLTGDVLSNTNTVVKYTGIITM